MNWPQKRVFHAITIISDLHVMMVGGCPRTFNGFYGLDTIPDSWLFNIDTKTWTKVSY